MSESHEDQIAQQKEQQAKRERERKAYELADKNMFEYYRKKFEEQSVVYNFGDLETELEELEGQAGQADMEVDNVGQKPPKELLPYGIYPVRITDKDALVFKDTDIKVNYNSKGVRPNKDTPEAWRACIAFLVKNTLCETVVLTVSENPHFPDREAARLKNWVKDCISLGVEAELSGSSQQFLFGKGKTFGEKIGGKFGLKDKAEEINGLIELSKVALAEARIERAANWIGKDKTAMEEQRAKPLMLAKVYEANTPTETITADVEVMMKDLESRMEKLESIQERLEELKEAEERILSNPDAVVEMHKEKKGDIKTPEAAKNLVKSDDDVKSNKTNIDTLLLELERGREDVVAKKDELRQRLVTIKDARPEDKKKEFSKGVEKLNVGERLAKLDLSAGTANALDPSSLKSRKTASETWNATGREALKTRPPEERPQNR